MIFFLKIFNDECHKTIKSQNICMKSVKLALATYIL